MPALSRSDRQNPESFRLLNSDDVADMLGMDSRTVRRMALAGRFPRVEIGHRTIRFRLADVLEFTEANTTNENGGRPATNGTTSQARRGTAPHDEP